MGRSYVHLELAERALIETQLRLGYTARGNCDRLDAGPFYDSARDTPQRLEVSA